MGADCLLVIHVFVMGYSSFLLLDFMEKSHVVSIVQIFPVGVDRIYLQILNNGSDLYPDRKKNNIMSWTLTISQVAGPMAIRIFELRKCTHIKPLSLIFFQM